MPVRPDAPLRKVTLNLYEADCIRAEEVYGHGWSSELRRVWNEHLEKYRSLHNAVARTLGDLADE